MRWVGFLVSRPQQCTRWALGGGDSSGRVEARVVEVTTVSVLLSAEHVLASSLTHCDIFLLIKDLSQYPKFYVIR